jgi:cell division protein FtsN
MARDYKHTRGSSGGHGMSASGGFVIGLLLGLTVATAIYIYDRRPGALQTTERAPISNEKQDAHSEAPTPESAQTDTKYDFYDVLPKMEVEVANDKNKENGSAGAIDAPGSYILQVGSYRNFADADRLRAKLAIQGVESSIQKISVEGDEWNRVRIGPITNLNKLEDTRRKLREAQIDALVIKQGK